MSEALQIKGFRISVVVVVLVVVVVVFVTAEKSGGLFPCGALLVRSHERFVFVLADCF